MPASIAHMIIAHQALKGLASSKMPDLVRFACLIDDTSQANNSRPYMNLGSIGPDLYYYQSISRSVRDMITEGYVRAAPVTAWSYHLHSCRPNEVPLSLIEVLFSDSVREGSQTRLADQDIQKLAYIAGHLTHIAADQIIHPLVNAVAGPYYRDGENRRIHRQMEVFQDYYLYEQFYRHRRQQASRSQQAQYNFFSQDFAGWVDCIKGLTTRNTAEWFRYFLQRGLVDCYGSFPSEEAIEDSVDNLLLTLRACLLAGPYKEAAKEYEAMGEDSPMYRRYVLDIGYAPACRQAIHLAAVYLIALFEVYVVLEAGRDFTDRHRRRFCKIVSGADLSCPLERDILGKALAALTSGRSRASKYRQAIEVAVA